MALAKITGQGLTAMAFLVALLWACLVGERLIVRNATQEAHRVLRENHNMQMHRHAQPVNTRKPFHTVRPDVG